ncbi:MAG: uncharacterized protein JWO80_2917 [Bryobacterales bacterium]|nr:uncharacterized protein [Bryobacterales bacterium]
MSFFDPESANFLDQCWELRRWSDGVRFLAHPLRSWLYRLRRRATARWRTGPQAVESRLEAPPLLCCDIAPVFGRLTTLPASIAGRDLIFRDADEQLRGWLRLAGGARRGDLNALDDMEDRHAYHRLYWAVRFARAAAFGHAHAAAGLVRQLETWMRLQGDLEPSALAAYTVAERIASLVETIFWIGHQSLSSLQILVPSIKRQIWKDAQHLSKNIEYGLGVHNHLLNNARGLYLAATTLLECDRSPEWKRQAFEIWDEYFPALVLCDGAFAEQSSHYHLLLCRTALEYCLAAYKSGHQLPGGFEEKAKAMFRLANDLLRPDGSIPRFGDNSPDGPIRELWGLLTAAYQHKLLNELPRHFIITPLTLYYGGTPYYRGRTELPTTTTDRTRLYSCGGYAFLRSADGSAEVAVHADPRAETRGHGDAGRGSFELWSRGNVLIREPGCFLSHSAKRAKWYRTGQAQNVTCIEGLAPAVASHDRARLPAWYGTGGGTWKVLSDLSLRFDCDAFRRIRADLGSSRTWTWTDEGSLRFEEWILGSGTVRFSSRLCLGDGNWGPLHWDLASGCGTIDWRGDGGKSARLVFRVPFGVTGTIEPGSFVPEYGVEKPARVIVLQGVQTLPFRWTMGCEFPRRVQSI